MQGNCWWEMQNGVDGNATYTLLMDAGQLLMGMQNGVAFLENSLAWQFLKKGSWCVTWQLTLLNEWIIR